MVTMDMKTWRTGIAEVVSTDTEEEVIIRGRKLSDLTGSVTFAEMMYLMFTGNLPTAPQARVLDALLVASVEHGIAPPSMIARCFASYGTTIQAAVGGGIMAFGDRMGGLGEQLAKLMSERVTAISGDPASISEERLREEARNCGGSKSRKRTSARLRHAPAWYGPPCAQGARYRQVRRHVWGLRSS